MTKFYATLDSDGPFIEQNANIVVFDRLVDAEQYLHDAYPADEWLEDGYVVKITEGHFGDCWIKTRKAPRVGADILSPFNYNAVSIQAPGSHPGGSGYWLTPYKNILVADLVAAEEEMMSNSRGGQHDGPAHHHPPEERRLRP
jgi:hypothetical protein